MIYTKNGSSINFDTTTPQPASTVQGVQGSLIDIADAIKITDDCSTPNAKGQGNNYYVDPSVFINYIIEAVNEGKDISSFKISVAKNAEGMRRMVIMAIDENGKYISINDMVYDNIRPCPDYCGLSSMKGSL